MDKPKWIVFDLGGVLLDWVSSSTKTAEFLGITHDKLFDVLFDQTVDVSIGAKMDIGEISTHSGWMEVLTYLKKSQLPDEIISHWFAKEFWLEDTLKLLVELKSAGYKLAIMSNSWLGLTNPANKHTLPTELELFDKIFDSSQEGLKKPDADFYKLVEVRTKTQGNELLFIDDDRNNLDAAKVFGWQTFLYKIGHDRGIEMNILLRKKLL